MKRVNSQTPREKDRQKGSVVVEFAIVLPILVIVLLGIMEVGSIARDYQACRTQLEKARDSRRFRRIRSVPHRIPPPYCRQFESCRCLSSE